VIQVGKVKYAVWVFVNLAKMEFAQHQMFVNVSMGGKEQIALNQLVILRVLMVFRLPLMCANVI
jgi:hypothetical protein